MANGLSRQIVNSEKILKDGVMYMRLYVYDAMETFITVVDMPVKKSRFISEMDEIEEVPEDVVEKEETTSLEEIEDATL